MPLSMTGISTRICTSPRTSLRAGYTQLHRILTQDYDSPRIMRVWCPPCQYAGSLEFFQFGYSTHLKCLDKSAEGEHASTHIGLYSSPRSHLRQRRIFPYIYIQRSQAPFSTETNYSIINSGREQSAAKVLKFLSGYPSLPTLRAASILKVHGPPFQIMGRVPWRVRIHPVAGHPGLCEGNCLTNRR